LRQGDIIQMRPRASAVLGNPYPSVIADHHMIGIRRIDPDAVNIAVHVIETILREGLAAILGIVDIHASKPDLQIVVRIDANLAEV
jgi:hypothetical protein